MAGRIRSKVKKVISVIVGAVLVAGLSGVAFARDSMQLDRRVQVRVEPTVTIIELAPLPAPSIRPGKEDAVIEVGWQVDSNQEMLRIGAAASDLFKGGVPNGPYSLVRKGGVKIHCPLAGTIDGVSNVALFGPETASVNGFTLFHTNGILFESSQNNRFSMPCYLTFTWNSTSSELPTGQYSGYVRFIATLVPPL